MKKNYFFTLLAMLLMAMPTAAQVGSMSDLFGKYKFTATVTTTEAGAAYADKFKSDCEVTIQKSESQYFMADILGFAGADYSMSVAEFSAENSTFVVNGPNNANYGIWDGYIAVANEKGEWPFSIWNVEGSVQYGMTFTFDPETKEITVPDFTIVSLNWSDNTTNILANVSNVKLTLVEGFTKDTSKYPDLTGLWTWEGGLRTDTVSLKSFNVEFTMADDTKENWNAKFTFGDYESFTLPATFDGSMVTIPHDTLFLDKENGIRFGVRSNRGYTGAFTFSYNSKTSMTLYDYIYIRKDVYEADTLKGAGIYQVFDGYITRENPDAYDWSGVYKVTVPDLENLTDSIEFPEEFDMVIVKKPGNLYYITEILGYENQSIPFTPTEDDAAATIELGGGYYGFTMLQYIGQDNGDYAYHALTDGNGESTTIAVTKNEDGTLSLGDFSVSYYLWTANTYSPLASFVGATATKQVFDWAGLYELTATVETEDASTYPSAFDVLVELDTDGKYRVKKFMNQDFYTLNQGATILNIAEDNNSATLALNDAWGHCFVAGSYPDYFTLNDKDGGVNPLNIVVYNGTLIMDDFTVHAFNWDTQASNKVATYTNVVLTRKSVEGAIENIAVENNSVKGIYDMLGRKLDAITVPGLYIVNGKKMIVK